MTCRRKRETKLDKGSFRSVKVVPTPWRCFFLILVLLISIFQHTTSLDWNLWLPNFRWTWLPWLRKNKMAVMDFNTFSQQRYLKNYYIFSSETNFTFKSNVTPVQPTRINDIVQIFIFLVTAKIFSSRKWSKWLIKIITVIKIMKISHLF